MTTPTDNPIPVLHVCPPCESFAPRRGLDYIAARKQLTPEILASFRDESVSNDDVDLVRLLDLVMSIDTSDRLHGFLADAVIMEMVAAAPADSDHPVVVAAIARVDDATAAAVANTLVRPPVDSPTSRAFQPKLGEQGPADFDDLTPAQMAMFAADYLGCISAETVTQVPAVAHALAHAQAGVQALIDLFSND
jgi:hypothetical protein